MTTEITPARVYLHDGALRRIGQLSAKSVNRSYHLQHTSAARCEVGEDELLLRELMDEAVGVAVVIESDAYPLPWVGKITSPSSGQEGALTISATSLDGILARRFLLSDAAFTGTVSQVFAAILAAAGNGNPHGIAAATDNPPGMKADGNYPNRSALSALNELAQRTGSEWWLQHEVSAAGVITTARIAPARGRDHAAHVILVEGGNIDRPQWSIDREAATFSQTVVGGQSSVTQAYTARNRSTRLAADFARARDGLAVEGARRVGRYVTDRSGASASSALTRGERLQVSEALKDAGLVEEAAAAMVARPPRPVRTMRLRSLPPEEATAELEWRLVEPGDVVTLLSHSAFGFGYEGPVRVLAVEPFEERGELHVVCEVVTEG